MSTAIAFAAGVVLTLAGMLCAGCWRYRALTGTLTGTSSRAIVRESVVAVKGT